MSEHTWSGWIWERCRHQFRSALAITRKYLALRERASIQLSDCYCERTMRLPTLINALLQFAMAGARLDPLLNCLPHVVWKRVPFVDDHARGHVDRSKVEPIGVVEIRRICSAGCTLLFTNAGCCAWQAEKGPPPQPSKLANHNHSNGYQPNTSPRLLIPPATGCI
jgi:hypothetical protein